MDIDSLLPSKEQVNENIITLCKGIIQPISDKFDEQVESWDTKIIRLRKEFDINKINTALKSKADLVDFNSQF